MPGMPWLGTGAALRVRAGWPFRMRRIGRGGTIGVPGVLGHASVERGDPCFLLLDDGDEMDDHLAHDQRGLSLTGGIQRKPHWR
jgi:hypothetical protein